MIKGSENSDIVGILLDNIKAVWSKELENNYNSVKQVQEIFNKYDKLSQ